MEITQRYRLQKFFGVDWDFLQTFPLPTSSRVVQNFFTNWLIQCFSNLIENISLSIVIHVPPSSLKVPSGVREAGLLALSWKTHKNKTVSSKWKLEKSKTFSLMVAINLSKLKSKMGKIITPFYNACTLILLCYSISHNWEHKHP